MEEERKYKLLFSDLVMFLPLLAKMNEHYDVSVGYNWGERMVILQRRQRWQAAVTTGGKFLWMKDELGFKEFFFFLF